MTTSETRHSLLQYHTTMDDRMDMDPPSPQRPGVLTQEQQQLEQRQRQLQQRQQQFQLQQAQLQQQHHDGFQSACPAMRASNYHHAQMPTSLAHAHYDPVHSSIDDSWNSEGWHAPPFSHSFSHQRLPSISNSFQNAYHHHPTNAHGQAAFQPQPNQLPFGYQAAHHPAPLAPGPFSGPLGNAPASFGRQRGSVPGGGPGGQGSLGTQSFGGESTLGQAHQQFTHSTDFNMLAAFGHTGLRPQPSSAQQGNSSGLHNLAPAWHSQQQWAGPQAYPYATRPPLPLAISHPHPPRASHSSRRHRHSMPRSATITNGDLDDSVPPRNRQPSAFDDRLREAQAFRGSLITKRVASVKAIKSLKTVPISELPEDERMCNICYNEFGVETPEKVTETPVQLPGCKHVFGDRCLKTWFEDSNLCPYCREAVESEMRSFMPHGGHGALSTPGAVQLRAVLMQNPELLQRIYDDPELVSELIIGRTHHSEAHDDLVPPVIPPQERRAPPTNSEEGHRRQRPRRGSWVAAAMQQPHQGAFLGRSRPIGTDLAPRPTEPGRGASSQRRSATPPQLVRSGAATSANLSPMTTRSQATRPAAPPIAGSPPQNGDPAVSSESDSTLLSEPPASVFSRPRTRNHAGEFGSESSLE